MGIATLVSVEEYLSTSFRPDREYLDGIIVERNLGESDHSRLQALLSGYILNREESWNVQVFTEQRVQVKPTRFRVPDICVVLGQGPVEPVFTAPPFLCIEILSKADTFDSVQERVGDYLDFGVRYVWVVNPRARRAYVYTAQEIREAKDGVLRTGAPEIVVPLAEIFAKLPDTVR